MGELLASVSSRELAEWMAYEQLEPFPETRADLRNAILCQAVMMSNGFKVDLKDFIPDLDRPWKEVQERTFEQQKLAISRVVPTNKDGLIICYEGDAPPIKRIGKRGKITPEKKRLQEILRGKSR